MMVGTYIMLLVQSHQPERKPWKSPKTSLAHRYTPPSPGKRWASSMTAMPCGQKKSTSEMIQSQTVTPPLAAIEGTTLRLKTATTKSKTRSHRPSTRRRCGASLARGAAGAVMTSFVNDALSMVRGPKLPMTYKETVRAEARRLHRALSCPRHRQRPCRDRSEPLQAPVQLPQT